MVVRFNHSFVMVARFNIHLLWWSVLTFLCYGGPFQHSFVMAVRFNNLFVIGGPF